MYPPLPRYTGRTTLSRVPLTIQPILNNTKTTNSYARGPITKPRAVSFCTVQLLMDGPRPSKNSNAHILRKKYNKTFDAHADKTDCN
ncbi:hypothetical protein DPMN_039976 [Dreissena polymorpha]|uniref:Uncharacterized protein n=1 Tax=Dreissena polymorpha TaxID=45954 RepID=A0A9D4CUD3_DREPO|nr:hypothetical protein DPMN_039976 [Dreissena polymorpha]